MTRLVTGRRLQARAALLALTIILAATLAGCLGGQSRSEWAYDTTEIRELNDSGRSGAGVRVAVLDTGINVAHPSLQHLTDGRQENGELAGFRDYVQARHGVDNAYDDIGHGTHVAGIISARGSSFSDKLLYGGVDLLGGAPNSLLLIAKVCGTDGCAGDGIIAAIDWAISQRAQIISMSLGGQASILSLDDDALRSATQRALDRGIVVVVSAGNSGPGSDDPANDVSTPADVPGAIAVGAVDDNLRVADFSSRGSNGRCDRTPVVGGLQGRCYPNQKPELVAPGVDILSAWTEDVYVRAGGTSQATPFVTAAVALILEGRPALTTAAQVATLKRVLVDTAEPVSGARTPHDDAAGYGLVQAARALRAYGG